MFIILTQGPPPFGMPPQMMHGGPPHGMPPPHMMGPPPTAMLPPDVPPIELWVETMSGRSLSERTLLIFLGDVFGMYGLLTAPYRTKTFTGIKVSKIRDCQNCET